MSNEKTIEININFTDEKDKYIIYADLCGVDKKDIKLELAGRTVLLQATRDFGDKCGFQKTEIVTGNLSKAIQLEDDIDNNDISAEYNDGLLIIILPKLKSETINIPLM